MGGVRQHNLKYGRAGGKFSQYEYLFLKQHFVILIYLNKLKSIFNIPLILGDISFCFQVVHLRTRSIFVCPGHVTQITRPSPV